MHNYVPDYTILPTVRLNGTDVTPDTVFPLMHQPLREALERHPFDSDQSFVDAYCAAHFGMFREPFIIQ